ncbi:hypothetical protein OG594_15835 [Streptomyces sp. NBC_01214]|uniref:hypothetical protein n=1 Tax=Streptomyces sp. NBC_01214 TaxID=2903777 RepID=UPI00225A1285|nr:hypothetical protein [Streptomyces sp. NBC_01214]MCX4803106.1 hypothetical protein [Streptomyces sp. NBC_01214]
MTRTSFRTPDTSRDAATSLITECAVVNSPAPRKWSSWATAAAAGRTLLHHIGLAHQGRSEKLHGIDDSRIPVVCVNAPPEPGSPADWSATLAVFIGWNLYRSDTEQRPVQRM